MTKHYLIIQSDGEVWMYLAYFQLGVFVWLMH